MRGHPSGPGMRAHERERELTGHDEAAYERTAWGPGVGSDQPGEADHPGYEEDFPYEGAPDDPHDITPDQVVELEHEPEVEPRRAHGRPRAEVKAPALPPPRPPAPRLAPDATIDALMTRQAVTVAADARLEEAAGALLEAGARHLPVVDADERVVGMLSDRDIRGLLGLDPREWARADPAVLDDVVANVMTPDPLVLEANASVLAAIEVFAEERVGAVPVVDENERVVGVLSYVDILEWVRDQLSPQVTA